LTLLLLLACQREQPAAQQAPQGPAPVGGLSPAEAERQRATADLPAPAKRGEDFRRGVSLGLFVSERDPQARRFYYEQLLDEIKEVGATDVQLVVRWAQDDVGAVQVAPDPAVTSPDELVNEVIGLCRARGLRVFLLPILHLRRMGPGEWRGKLKPADLDAWWTSYGAFMEHYAKLAAANEVELLSVGSELLSMERHEDRWRALIQRVRALYPKGKLTYSANWDHFEPVQFWDALDVVGITAYQELSHDDDPDEAALVEGWGPFEQRVRLWAAQGKHRYIFTEVGFPSNTTGAARPWDYVPRGEPDPELQLRCFRATYKVWNDDPHLQGFYVWNWFGVGGPNDRGYTPRGKPSAHLLRRWFEGSR
jgi:hypothetical protein